VQLEQEYLAAPNDGFCHADEGSIWITTRIEVCDNQYKTLFMQLDASFVSMTEPIVWRENSGKSIPH
jgi:sugar lactone lactonase YvrE